MIKSGEVVCGLIAMAILLQHSFQVRVIAIPELSMLYTSVQQ